MEDPTTIVVSGDCDCPVCGAPEVSNRTDPVREWRFNVRAYRVTDGNGLSWSECIPCRDTDGDGWFATDEDGNIIVSPSRIPVLEARGKTVEKIVR